MKLAVAPVGTRVISGGFMMPLCVVVHVLPRSDPRNLRRLQPGLSGLLRLHRSVELPVPHPGRDLQCQPAHEALQKVFLINAGHFSTSEWLRATERDDYPALSSSLPLWGCWEISLNKSRLDPNRPGPVRERVVADDTSSSTAWFLKHTIDFGSVEMGLKGLVRRLKQECDEGAFIEHLIQEVGEHEVATQQNISHTGQTCLWK